MTELRDELSSYRGMILGWKQRCDVAENALQKRREEHSTLVYDVHSLERRLDSIQELLHKQSAQLRVREDRFEWMSSMALVISFLSIGLILTRGNNN